MRGRRRAAMTLVELLVVIAIIAVLIALLFPAVQAIREAARRLQCASNIKQVALACQHYHFANNYLPPSQIADGAVTWAVLILPYIEQNSLFQTWDINRRYYNAANAAARSATVNAYFCPSRSTPRLSLNGDVPDPSHSSYGSSSIPGGTSDYAGCGGDYAWSNRSWYAGWSSDLGFRANGAIVASSLPYNGNNPLPEPLTASWAGRVDMTRVRDGTSNTLLFGEKHVNPAGSNVANPGWALSVGWGYGSVYNGDNDPNFVRNAGPGLPLAPSDANETFSASPFQCFGSAHSGVCQFAMVDGRVISLSNLIDTVTLGLLASRNDGKACTIPD